jgi:hypothetical protein
VSVCSASRRLNRLVILEVLAAAPLPVAEKSCSADFPDSQVVGCAVEYCSPCWRRTPSLSSLVVAQQGTQDG